MNTKNSTIIRSTVLIGLMLVAAMTRLIPHPANLTAVMAIALFGGAKFKKLSFAILVPLLVLLMTDLIIGFYSLMPVVYACTALTVLIGKYAGQKSNPVFIVIGSIISSTLFFLVTNAAVWYHNPQYAQSGTGLWMCYDAGLPFYRNQVLGDLFFNGVLFGGFRFVRSRYPAIAV